MDVILTRDGFPMGHEVFPGDTAEVERFRVAGHAVPYDDLLRHLEQVKAVEINLDGKRYLARTELVGHADLAFRALGARPPQWVTELPRRRNDPGEECCGTRDSYAEKPYDDQASQKCGVKRQYKTPENARDRKRLFRDFYASFCLLGAMKNFAQRQKDSPPTHLISIIHLVSA